MIYNNRCQRKEISIHALLAESDFCKKSFRSLDTGISIHALLAESDRSEFLISAITSISIHALLAESDDYKGICVQNLEISIHALLAESDLENRAQDLANVAFLSTLSLRRATWHLHCVFIFAGISIHALLAESDSLTEYGLKWLAEISIHALLAESD